MKVLLVKDIPGVGHRGQVKDVSDGYAHNFLLARKLAVPAEADIATAIKNKDESDLRKREQEKEIVITELRSLDGLTVTISRKANEKGHLFAAIHAAEVLEEIRKIHPVPHVNVAMVKLEKPIKEVGAVTVTLCIEKTIAHCTFIVKALG